jgi:hypothetical protein
MTNRDMIFSRSGRRIHDNVPRAENGLLNSFPQTVRGIGPDPYSPALFSGGAQGSLPTIIPSVSSGPNLYPITRPGENGHGIRVDCSFPGCCGQGRLNPEPFKPVAFEGGVFHTVFIALVAVALWAYFSSR